MLICDVRDDSFFIVSTLEALRAGAGFFSIAVCSSQEEKIVTCMFVGRQYCMISVAVAGSEPRATEH